MGTSHKSATRKAAKNVRTFFLNCSDITWYNKTLTNSYDKHLKRTELFESHSSSSINRDDELVKEEKAGD